MAETNSHFALVVIVGNGWLSEGNIVPDEENDTNSYAAKMRREIHSQTDLVRQLRASSKDRESLRALLKDPDPKVRTLALGALFQRDDGRDLPLIGSLIGDNAPTFPGLRDTQRASGGPPDENPQTVGDVVQSMLEFWGVHHTGFGGTHFGSSRIIPEDFAAYWRKYEGREYSASWFAVKMRRATRWTVPIQAEYKADIQRVEAEMQSLPMPDRAWIQLYVLAPQGLFAMDTNDFIMRDRDLIALIKPLGPAALLRFLQRERISDDPDLLIDKDDQLFVTMSDFILRHADELLRPEDSDALLAGSVHQKQSGGPDPAWAIGAALVQPQRASKILRDTLAHETRDYETAAGKLAGALWSIRGPAEMDFLVNWFYTVLPGAREPQHQPVAFLSGVRAAARPDTKKLLSALVKDKRFDTTDWATLKEILQIVNEGRATPLVETTDIYDAMPNHVGDPRTAYPLWRNLLRREFGFPAEPLPAAEAKPKHLVTEPKWSVRLPELFTPPLLMVASSDGKWLATLTNGAVGIWEATSGKLAWTIPDRPREAWSRAFQIAFEPGGRRVIVLDNVNKGRVCEWDFIEQRKISEGPLSRRTPDGVNKSYRIDGQAQRAVFSSFDKLFCFELRPFKALWSQPGVGGPSGLAAISSDGTRAAAGGGFKKERAINVYDVASGKRLQQFDKFTAKVLGIGLSDDGRKLATATDGDGLQLWDAKTGKLIRNFAWCLPDYGTSGPVFSSDGKWLAIGRMEPTIGDFSIGVFRVNTGELVWELRPKIIASGDFPMAFSPDAKTLYVCHNWLQAWPLAEK